VERGTWNANSHTNTDQHANSNGDKHPNGDGNQYANAHNCREASPLSAARRVELPMNNF
jgi:hypothetical protein